MQMFAFTFSALPQTRTHHFYRYRYSSHQSHDVQLPTQASSLVILRSALASSFKSSFITPHHSRNISRNYAAASSSSSSSPSSPSSSSPSSIVSNTRMNLSLKELDRIFHQNPYSPLIEYSLSGTYASSSSSSSQSTNSTSSSIFLTSFRKFLTTATLVLAISSPFLRIPSQSSFNLCSSHAQAADTFVLPSQKANKQQKELQKATAESTNKVLELAKKVGPIMAVIVAIAAALGWGYKKYQTSQLGRFQRSMSLLMKEYEQQMKAQQKAGSGGSDAAIPNSAALTEMLKAIEGMAGGGEASKAGGDEDLSKLAASLFDAQYDPSKRKSSLGAGTAGGAQGAEEEARRILEQMNMPEVEKLLEKAIKENPLPKPGDKDWIDFTKVAPLNEEDQQVIKKDDPEFYEALLKYLADGNAAALKDAEQKLSLSGDHAYKAFARLITLQANLLLEKDQILDFGSLLSTGEFLSVRAFEKPLPEDIVKWRVPKDVDFSQIQNQRELQYKNFVAAYLGQYQSENKGFASFQFVQKFFGIERLKAESINTQVASAMFQETFEKAINDESLDDETKETMKNMKDSFKAFESGDPSMGNKEDISAMLNSLKQLLESGSITRGEIDMIRKMCKEIGFDLDDIAANADVMGEALGPEAKEFALTLRKILDSV